MRSDRDRRLLAPLRSRNFRALFYAQCVSVFGDFLVPVALAFALLDLGFSASALGFAIAARLVPVVLFLLAGGVYADRMQRHRLMVASHLVRAATQVTLGSLLVTGRPSLAAIVALQAVNGVATAFYRPASTAIVPTLVEDRADLQAANALMWGAWAVGGIVGPALAGLLVATVGGGWAIVGDGATFALAAVLLLRLGSAGLGRPAAKSGFLRELALGWAEVRARTWLWTSISYFSLFQLLNVAVLGVLGPVVAKQSLGGAPAWAAITSAAGAGGVIGYVVAPRVRATHPLSVAFLLTLPSVPTLFLLAVKAPVAVIAAAELVSFATTSVAGNLWETTLQESVPQEVLSRVSSYDWVGSMALRPLGLVVVGPVAAAVGAGTTLVGAALILLVATAALLSVPSVRRLSTASGKANLSSAPA